MDLTAKELTEEKETAFEFLSSAWLDKDVTKCFKAEESKCRLWLKYQIIVMLT